MWAVAIAVLATTVLAFSAKAVTHPNVVVKEFKHPVRALVVEILRAAAPARQNRMVGHLL